MCAQIVAISLSLGYGTSPVSASKRTQPSAYTSVRASIGFVLNLFTSNVIHRPNPFTRASETAP
jgi:hypothetical protein